MPHLIYAEREMNNGEIAPCLYQRPISDAEKRKLRVIWEVPAKFHRTMTLAEIKRIAPGGSFCTKEGLPNNSAGRTVPE